MPILITPRHLKPGMKCTGCLMPAVRDILVGSIDEGPDTQMRIPLCRGCLTGMREATKMELQRMAEGAFEINPGILATPSSEGDDGHDWFKPLGSEGVHTHKYGDDLHVHVDSTKQVTDNPAQRNS